jgi:hypothetical protein
MRSIEERDRREERDDAPVIAAAGVRGFKPGDDFRLRYSAAYGGLAGEFRRVRVLREREQLSTG